MTSAFPSALLLLCTLFTCFAGPVSLPGMRLPDAVRPVGYEAELQLTPGQDPFSGTIAIAVEVRRPVNVIWLHAKELDLKKAVIRSGKSEVVAQVEPAEPDLIALTLSESLAPGPARVVIDYTGRISQTLTDGLFQQREAGDWYIFTKFEPVTARRAFPCFDEPSFKTPWELTLRVPTGTKAFANTPVEHEERGLPGQTVVRFARTQPLPSYLVAFAVGPFDEVATPRIGRKKVPGRILVPRGRGAEAEYAAAVTPQLIGLLEDYFGIPYPYEKLDQVVVPLTTSWGAIENAGLIGYGQFLLAKPGEDSIERQRTRATTMLHEISHQWLGDFVTTAWWDDLWLNEGFATWITSKLLARWHPEWGTSVSVVGSRNSVMSSDGLVSARKIHQPIEAPGDIANAFDWITYGKGAALIRMFENYLGEKVFQKAVRSYLEAHAWGNATTPDFLAALDRAAKTDLASAFSTFLDQNGVPLIGVEVRSDAGGPMLRLTQERYRPIGSRGDAGSVWRLPVCFKWSDGKHIRTQAVFLTGSTGEFRIRGAKKAPAWLLADANAAGYHRVSYEKELFDQLLERGASQLPLGERLALIENVHALVGAGRVETRQAMALSNRFSKAPEHQIVEAAIRLAGSLSQVLPDEMQPNYSRFVRSWLGPRARDLGWQPKPADSDDTRRIRLAIVPLVAIGGEDDQLGSEAIKLARAWLADRRAIDQESAGYVLIAAARHGDRSLYEEMLSEAIRTKDQQERYTLIDALGAFQDPEIMKSALGLVLGQSALDPRELTSLLLGQWRDTRLLVWEFIKENFETLNTRLPGARGIPFGATLPGIGGRFCDQCRRAELKDFFEPRISQLSGGARNLARALESIDLCVAKRDVLLAGFAEFLKEY